MPWNPWSALIISSSLGNYGDSMSTSPYHEEMLRCTLLYRTDMGNCCCSDFESAVICYLWNLTASSPLPLPLLDAPWVLERAVEVPLKSKRSLPLFSALQLVMNLLNHCMLQKQISLMKATLICVYKHDCSGGSLTTCPIYPRDGSVFPEDKWSPSHKPLTKFTVAGMKSLLGASLKSNQNEVSHNIHTLAA